VKDKPIEEPRRKCDGTGRVRKGKPCARCGGSGRFVKPVREDEGEQEGGGR